MLNKIMLVTIGVASLAAGRALAADLPASYAATLPLFIWTGAYYGINAGGAFDFENRGLVNGIQSNNNGVAAGDRPEEAKLSSSGIAAGGQVGFNYQLGGPSGGVVVGLEADLNYMDLAKTNSYVEGNGFESTFRSGLDYLGTARARIGYVLGRTMVYGTGGLAYGDVFAKEIFYTPNGSTIRYFGSKDEIQIGYAAGGGIEYALPAGSMFNFLNSSAVTVKAEYLYYSLGAENIIATPKGNAASGGYAVHYKADGSLARVGLNYKF